MPDKYRTLVLSHQHRHRAKAPDALNWLGLLERFNPLVGDYYAGARLKMQIATYADVPIGLYLLYYPVFRRLRFDQIAIRVQGAGGAGAAIRLGIYADNGSRYPSALILDAGTVDATAAAYRSIAINVTLDPDNYYLAVLTNDATIDFRAYQEMFPLRGGSGLDCVDWCYGGYQILGYAWGPLPDPFPAGAQRQISLWTVALRVAEVF